MTWEKVCTMRTYLGNGEERRARVTAMTCMKERANEPTTDTWKQSAWGRVIRVSPTNMIGTDTAPLVSLASTVGIALAVSSFGFQGDVLDAAETRHDSKRTRKQYLGLQPRPPC